MFKLFLNVVLLVNAAVMVASEECPEREIYRCPLMDCEEYCPESRDSQEKCLVILNCSERKCICKPNYRRDRETNYCIPTRKCPPFKCGPNEVFNPCPSSCPGDSCAAFNSTVQCLRKRPYCLPNCTCMEGFYRNSQGNCVSAAKCLIEKALISQTRMKKYLLYKGD